MGITIVLIVFFMGLASDRWLAGLVAMVPISALLTAACFITTNNPAFTEIERALELTPASVTSNFLIKLLFLAGTYSAGFLCAGFLRTLPSIGAAKTGHSAARGNADQDRADRRLPIAPPF